jgi:CIC family chloride channel protein
MKSDSPSFEEQQFTRAQHRISIRRLLNRDKTPLAILLAAAVVGTLAGLVGVAFEKAVNAVLNWRVGTVAGFADSRWLVWVGRSGCRRCLPWWGIFWCVNLRRRRAAGIPEIEGALEELRPVRWWRVIPVKFIGGMGTLGAGMVLGGKGPRYSWAGTSAAWWAICFGCAAPKRAIRCWQPVRRRGFRRRLTRRWRAFCLSSKRCARSFATT